MVECFICFGTSWALIRLALIIDVHVLGILKNAARFVRDTQIRTGYIQCKQLSLLTYFPSNRIAANAGLISFVSAYRKMNTPEQKYSLCVCNVRCQVAHAKCSARRPNAE